MIHHGNTEGTEDSHGEQQNISCFFRVISVPSVSPW